MISRCMALEKGRQVAPALIFASIRENTTNGEKYSLMHLVLLNVLKSFYQNFRDTQLALTNHHLLSMFFIILLTGVFFS